MSIRLLIGVMLVLFCGALAGCSAPGGQLQVTRTDTGQAFSQTFEEAWIARDDDGDYDILLVYRSIDRDRSVRPGERLQPVERLPVRHVVHIHTFWRPKGSTRSDDPAASNATVNWYVLTTGATAGEDVLIYRGTGFVGVYPGEEAAGVTLRNVRIEPQLVRGAMTDPLGSANISGSIQALADREKVRALLEELHVIASRNDP